MCTYYKENKRNNTHGDIHNLQTKEKIVKTANLQNLHFIKKFTKLKLFELQIVMNTRVYFLIEYITNIG